MSQYACAVKSPPVRYLELAVYKEKDSNAVFSPPLQRSFFPPQFCVRELAFKQPWKKLEESRGEQWPSLSP